MAGIRVGELELEALRPVAAKIASASAAFHFFEAVTSPFIRFSESREVL